MTTVIASLMLALVATVSPSPSAWPPNPPYMQVPVGWKSLGPPPPGAPVDYAWVSPRAGDGSAHAGDSMSASVQPIPPNSNLADQVKELIAELTQDGRTVASSRSHATCGGRQPGWTVDLRLQIMPTLTLSQVEHLAVYKGHVYAIMFMHRADLPVDAIVQTSIDSLCPMKS